MNILEKSFKHLKLILEHKKLVFKYCCIAGIPYRGLVHDLSKFSPIEFIESAKYYTGTGSPINECKKAEGMSRAWLHHKGRNLHHFEYWVDTDGTPRLIPWEYATEMCCDMLAAGQVYLKDAWTEDYPLQYWNEQKEKRNLHPVIREYQTLFFTSLKNNGLKGITKKKTQKMYNYCVNKYKKEA